MNFKKKIRTALVGCGRVSKYHLDAVTSLKDRFELVALCDNNSQKLDMSCKKYKVAGYKNLEQMLEKEKIDLLSICTPNGLHCENAILAGEYNVEVLCEKPLATKLEDGLKMYNTFLDKKLELHVVKQNRYNEPLRKLKEAIEQNKFGKIHIININVFWTRPQSYYDQDLWRGTTDLDGGALMNQASHYIDLIHWLGGPVKSIQCMSSTFLNIDVEDTAVLNVKWANGTIGSVSVTMLTYPQNLEGSITVLGEKGSAKIGGVACNKIEVWDFKDVDEKQIDLNNLNYLPKTVYGNGHLSLYKKIADNKSLNLPPPITAIDGLNTLEIIIAAYRSAEKDGKTIELPIKIK